jgi:hypothetical protein
MDPPPSRPREEPLEDELQTPWPKHFAKHPRQITPALQFRRPRPGEHWLSYLAERRESIERHMPNATPGLRQTVQSRADVARKYRYVRNALLVVYELDKEGRITSAESHSNADNYDLHDGVPPWDKRFLPELGIWEFCEGWHVPDEYRMTDTEKVNADYGPMDPYEVDEFDPDASVPGSHSASAKWTKYQRKYPPFIRQEDYDSIRVPDAPPDARSRRREPDADNGMDVDDHAPLPLPLPVEDDMAAINEGQAPALDDVAARTPPFPVEDDTLAIENTQVPPLNAGTQPLPVADEAAVIKNSAPGPEIEGAAPPPPARLPTGDGPNEERALAAEDLTAPVAESAVAPSVAVPEVVAAGSSVPVPPPAAAPSATTSANTQAANGIERSLASRISASRKSLRSATSPLSHFSLGRRDAPHGGFDAAPPRERRGQDPKRPRKSATWAPAPTADENLGTQETHVIDGRFDLASLFDTVPHWDLDPERLADQRMCYRASTEEIGNDPTNYTHFKNPWAAMAFVGARPQCGERASVEEVATATGLTVARVRRLWAFAEGRKTKGVSPDPRLDTLAQAALPALQVHLAQGTFDVTPVPVPDTARAMFKLETDVCWILDEKPSRLDESFVLCVTDPLAVLFALHSESSTLSELALQFVGQGVPFFMPQRLDLISDIPEEDMRAYRHEQDFARIERENDYEFKATDYQSYLSIFRNYVKTDFRFARLALLGGGAPWRLALPYCDLQSVLLGPSGHSKSQDESMSVRFTYRGVTLADDRFLDGEINVAHGVVTIHVGANEAYPSFFPPYNRWHESAYGYVGWSAAAEQFFLKMDTEYRTVNVGDETMKLVTQPCVQSRWPRRTGKAYELPKLLMTLRTRAAAFLAASLTPPAV